MTSVETRTEAVGLVVLLHNIPPPDLQANEDTQAISWVLFSVPVDDVQVSSRKKDQHIKKLVNFYRILYRRRLSSRLLFWKWI